MNWRRACMALPTVTAALSLWLPWVDNRSAALVLAGLDLPEFVRFMGAAGGPLVQPMQLAFALPLLVAAGVLSLSAWSYNVGLWFRAALLVLVLWLVGVAFSPLERRTEFVQAAAFVIAIWLGAAVLRPAPSVALWTAALGGTVSGLATLWQFGRAIPALDGLYGGLVWGLGPRLTALAVLVGLGVSAAAIFRYVRVARQRTAS